MKLSFEEQEKIIEDAADACKMDVRISHMARKADLHTAAEKLMGQRAFLKGKPYKQSYLWCDAVDICFFFSDQYEATACATFTALWSVGIKDLTTSAAVNAVRKVEDMLALMQKKANAVMVEKLVAGGRNDDARL